MQTGTCISSIRINGQSNNSGATDVKMGEFILEEK